MSMNKIIITIDGPSGSGKTTLGRAISKKLGITFFSSGSIYRVITKYFLDTNFSMNLKQSIHHYRPSNFFQDLNSVFKPSSHFSNVSEIILSASLLDRSDFSKKLLIVVNT